MVVRKNVESTNACLAVRLSSLEKMKTGICDMIDAKSPNEGELSTSQKRVVRTHADDLVSRIMHTC